MGKLIVIEGVDSSGKATQTAMLAERLAEKEMPVRQVSFPDYESDFSLPVRRYLAGDLGSEPGDVNAYAASVLYAIDRYASFRRAWGDFYCAGGVVVADRYVTSNMVHQAAKIAGDKQPFLGWLADLEYDKLGLPRPDAVLFLDMPPAYAIELMRQRNNKITGRAEKDIHERNSSYLEASYANAVEVAQLEGWHTIHCVAEGCVRTPEDIAAELYEWVRQMVLD